MPEDKEKDIPEENTQAKKTDENEISDDDLVAAFTDDSEDETDAQISSESDSSKNSESSENDSEPELKDEEFERPEWDKEEYAKLSKPKKILFKVKEFFKDTKKRNLFLSGATLVALLLVLIIPASRFPVLNALGVRANASFKVVDSDSQAPLTNVLVKLGDSETRTNLEGVAQFTSVRLGDQKILISLDAYETYEETVRINSGSNQIPDKNLTPRGQKYTFKVVDFLSENPINNAVVSFGEVGTSVDESGVATVSVGAQEQQGDISFTVSAEQYSEQVIEIDQASLNNDVKLAPAVSNYFVSKRDGRMDIYKVDADGNNEELVLKGTGNEDTSSRLAVSDNGEYIVWVASRQEIKNDNGYMLDQLYIFKSDDDLENLNESDRSERIDLIGLHDNNLIYVKVAAGASGRSPERHRLVSFNLETGTSTEIAASNYFNDVVVTEEYIFYAPSNAFREESDASLYRVNLDGSDVREVFDEEVWTVIREDVKTIGFDSLNEWYSTPVEPLAPVKQSSKPASVASKIYFAGPEGKLAYIDFRDGQGYIIVLDPENNLEENIVAKIAGAKPPLRWLSDKHLSFRVNTSNETADYVVNIESGDSKKIVDVTDIRGIDRWYFYY